jgi:hypothetical protein
LVTGIDTFNRRFKVRGAGHLPACIPGNVRLKETSWSYLATLAYRVGERALFTAYDYPANKLVIFELGWNGHRQLGICGMKPVEVPQQK